MATATPSTELLLAIEDLVTFLRRLPARPALSLNAASALRAAVVDGPLRISALVDRLGISQPAVTQLVDRLVEEGLAGRAPDPEDRRAVLVHATEAGRSLLETRRGVRAAALDGILEQLAAEDRAELLACVPVLRQFAQLTNRVVPTGHLPAAAVPSS